MRLAERQRVVLGPPGCGKTTALLQTLEKKLEEGIAPQRVAYFSFTRKAVREARERAEERFDLAGDDLPFFRTIHSMVFALNGHSKDDVLGRPHFAEISRALNLRFSGTEIDETLGLPLGGADGDLHLFLDTLARARQVPLYEQWETSRIPDLDFRAVERTAAAVKHYKEVNALVDFTDMLEIYRTQGQPLAVDVAFVDEAQDLSRLQWMVLLRLLENCSEVHIAGDDDQAIYRWSGADVATFLTLEGEQQQLTQSWRCSRAVHSIAAAISRRIQHRYRKIWSARDIVGNAVRVHSVDSFNFEELQGSTLLLARNRHLLALYTDELRKRGLPFMGAHGYRSVRPAHARAIYAYTKMIRGGTISGAETKLFYDQLRAGIGVRRGYKGLATLANDTQVTEEDLRRNHGLLARGHWYDALDGMSGDDRTYYRSILRGKRNLLEEPTIQVNTIHGVKGGEADNVVICSDMARRSYDEYERNADDEHRVAYVAVSRARNNVYIVAPQTKNAYPYPETMQLH